MGITAADLMSTNVAKLTAEMDLLQMDTVLFKRGVSGAPVVDGNVLVGVASQFDLIRAIWEVQHEAHDRAVPDFASPYPIPLAAIERMSQDAPSLGERLKSLRVADIMTPDPIVARPDETLDELAERMTSDQLHRLPVVEPETGELVGVVSALDIVAAVPRYGLALAV